MHKKRVLASLVIISLVSTYSYSRSQSKRFTTIEKDKVFRSSDQVVYNRKRKEMGRRLMFLAQQDLSSPVVATPVAPSFLHEVLQDPVSEVIIPLVDYQSPFYDISVLLQSPSARVDYLLEKKKTEHPNVWSRCKEFFGFKDYDFRVRLAKEYGEVNPYLKQFFKENNIKDVRTIDEKILHKHVRRKELKKLYKKIKIKKEPLVLKTEFKALLDLLEDATGRVKDLDLKPLFISMYQKKEDEILAECAGCTRSLSSRILSLLEMQSLGKDEAALVSTDSLLAFLHARINKVHIKVVRSKTDRISCNTMTGIDQWHTFVKDMFKDKKSYKALCKRLSRYIEEPFLMTQEGSYRIYSVLPSFINEFSRIIPQREQQPFLKLLQHISYKIEQGLLYYSPKTVSLLNSLLKKNKK